MSQRHGGFRAGGDRAALGLALGVAAKMALAFAMIGIFLATRFF